MYVPAFKVETQQDNVNELEGFSISSDNSLQVANARQKTTIEFFTAPAGDGTPKITPDYPADANIKVIDDSFIFVTVHNSLEESLELPLLVAEVERH